MHKCDSHQTTDPFGPALGRCHAMIFNRLFLTLFGFSVCCFQPTAWAGEASSPSIEAGNQSAEMLGVARDSPVMPLWEYFRRYHGTGVAARA